MTNQSSNPNVPSLEEALISPEVIAPEVLGVLLGQLEEEGKFDIALRIIDRQLDNSKGKEQALVSRTHAIPGMLAYGRKQIIEAETALKQLNEKQAALKAELSTTLPALITQEQKRRPLLNARRLQFERHIGY